MVYVVWAGSDQLCWDLVRAKFPEYESMLVYWNNPIYTHETLVDKNGIEYPIEPEPSQIANSDLILLGGDSPNPYTKKYFTDTGLHVYDPVTDTIIGEGAYASGRRYIATIQRGNGTNVTAILGINAIDTFYTVQDFLDGMKNILQYAIPVGAGVGGLVIGYILGRRR